MPDPATEPHSRDRCARCGHVWSFHKKRMGATCAAMGCDTHGEGPRCTGFEAAEEAAEPLRLVAEA